MIEHNDSAFGKVIHFYCVANKTEASTGLHLRIKGISSFKSNIQMQRVDDNIY